jgi:hypothetical protein
MSSESDPLANLRAAYGDEFTFWRSDTGCCYATRRRRLSDHEMAAGLMQTVSGDDPVDLAQRMRVQEGLLERI